MHAISVLFLCVVYGALAAPAVLRRHECEDHSLPASDSNSTATVSSNTTNLVAASWYPDWLEDLTPDKVSWDKYTEVYYAFGCVPHSLARSSIDLDSVTTEDPSIIEINSTARLSEFVEAAHSNVCYI